MTALDLDKLAAANGRHGEPWTARRGSIRAEGGETVYGAPLAERTVACVNACAGMDDPAAAIAALIEAARARVVTTRYLPAYAELQARCARLEAALRPFAEAAKELDSEDRDEWEFDGRTILTNEHVRAARAALEDASDG